MGMNLIEKLTARPRVVFVNLVNELMISRPPEDYAWKMAIVTLRELCTCFPGDVLVIPSPMKKAFRSYCLELIGLPDSAVTVIDTPAPFTTPLATYFSDRNQFSRLKAAIQSGDYVLDSFGPDLPTIDLAGSLGIPLHGYDRLPSASVMAIYYQINTKAGFKKLAAELGLPVLEGRYCTSADSLYKLITSGFADARQYKIKLNRGSNGYGHVDIDLAKFNNGDLAEYIRQKLGAVGEQPYSYVLEPYIPFIDSPSVEMHISASGPVITYTCSMRVPGGAFTGMLTPPVQDEHETQGRLEQYGMTFGKYLHQHGVYGFCDVDAGLTADGKLVLTETNLRRTGGTYLDILLRRLIGENYTATHTWLADSRPLRDRLLFEDVLARLNKQNLAWDREKKRGVIVTGDTLSFDNRLRYLCVGDSASDVLAQEKSLAESVGFAD
jgi:hypothetical protein